MQDAVAEVLKERAAPARGVPTSVAVSFALHIALFVGFATAASRQAIPPERTVINMRLAAPSPRPPAATQRAAAAQPKVPTPTAPKPELKPAPVVPEPETVKPPKRTSEGKSLFGRSELEAPKSAKQTPPKPAAAAPPQTVPGTGTSPLPAVGKAGVTSLEGGPFPYSLYIDRMVTLVGTRWFRPDSGGEVLAQVYFVINRDGTIRDVKIEKSSGVASFDRAAYRAVLESSPLPPLPAAYSGTFLGVHLTFH